MAMLSVKETAEDELGHPVRSVLVDVFGVQGVNSMSVVDSRWP